MHYIGYTRNRNEVAVAQYKHFPNLTVFNCSSKHSVQVELFNGYIRVIPVNDCCATLLGPAAPVHADARILLPAWSTINTVKA
jgi:hypothetical protein